jgi:Na+/melibiose symporter-like transporter
MTELYESKKNRSLLTMISFSVSDLHLAFFSFALGQYLLLFYETEVNLGIWYVTLGYIIYAVWNAVNDPLIGFITDQPRSYWQKWGKRFPLIIMASVSSHYYGFDSVCFLHGFCLYTPNVGSSHTTAFLFIMVCFFSLFL